MWIGFLYLMNLTIYELFSTNNSTNWEIYYFVNQNILIIYLFFQNVFKTDIEVLKNFNKLVCWFFIYDSLSQILNINKPYEQYRSKYIEPTQLVMILISGLILFLVFKIRKQEHE